MIINGTQAAAAGATTNIGTGAASTAPAAATTGGITKAATLGGTDFLTLMLAQLKNQDPTSPVDSNTFLTQLAQLSEVQGINQLNTSFGSLSTSVSANQALQASSLLGHKALVSSSTAQLAAGGTVTGAVNVPQTTSSVVLSVTDAGGNVIRSIGLGAQSAGLANYSWDGKQSNGSQAPAGTYSLSVQYAGQTKDSAAAAS